MNAKMRGSCYVITFPSCPPLCHLGRAGGGVTPHTWDTRRILCRLRLVLHSLRLLRLNPIKDIQITLTFSLPKFYIESPHPQGRSSIPSPYSFSMMLLREALLAIPIPGRPFCNAMDEDHEQNAIHPYSISI